MEAHHRRAQLAEAIRQSKQPITGAELAKQFGISRQIIVQDIALLRAQGASILATPSGYIALDNAVTQRAMRVFTCRHAGRDELLAELMAVVDAGAIVRDVIVEHPVYGEISGSLMIATAQAACNLANRLNEPSSAPLSSVTGGVHMHTVEATDEDILNAVEKGLRALNILVD